MAGPVDGWDVVVAGSGPAGATAALVLARQGARVLIADRLRHRRPKLGETLPGAGVRLLRLLGLPESTLGGTHWPVGGNLVAWNSDQPTSEDAIRDPNGPGWRLDRDRFDADLRAAAAAAGAVYRAADVADLVRTGRDWLVTFEDGSQARARWIIDATGRRAALARKLGAARRRDPPLIAHYRIGCPSANGDLTRTLIEAGPEGWWYAGRIAGGRWIFGYHTDRVTAARINADPSNWERAFSQMKLLGDILGHTEFKPTITSVEARGAVAPEAFGDGWIVCGDAALSFDPIAGQGIFSALRTGMAAAEAIAADAESATRLTAYAAELADVRAIYRQRHRTLYRSEQRFTDQPFWRVQGG